MKANNYFGWPKVSFIDQDGREAETPLFYLVCNPLHVNTRLSGSLS